MALYPQVGLLDEDFFNEVEDLKFRYAKAQEQLEAYARQYGPIG